MCDCSSQSCKLSKLNSTSSVVKTAWTLRQVMTCINLSSQVDFATCKDLFVQQLHNWYHPYWLPQWYLQHFYSLFLTVLQMQRPATCFLGRRNLPLILVLPVLPQTKRCPAYAAPLQLLSFPLPDRITKTHGSWKEGSINSYRLDLEMQPLGRLMEVRHCHIYVHLHIHIYIFLHIPPYFSVKYIYIYISP